MSRDFEIVPFEPAHTFALRELYFQSRRATFSWIDSAKLKPADFDVAIEGETLLVALRDELPVGFVAWWPPENFIHSLFVQRDYQRQGIGSALLAACLAKMGRPAQLKCVQQNERALAFYRAHAWQVTGSGAGPDGPYYLLTFDE